MDVSNLFNVSGKVVLVTGGGRGIGYMIAQGYVENGAKVYISSRDAASCEKAAKELTAKGPGSAVALPADLQSLDECKRLAAELSAREPRLHVLVNNSGAAWGDSYDTYPDGAWTKLLTLNLQRVFTLTQLLTPLLEAAAAAAAASSPSDPARVIHIGSVDALRVPALANFAYSASKAGLHHLARALALELGPRGVTSNTLACGPFATRMMAATLDSAGDAIRDANPLGRIGRPEDVAGACLWLSSKAGSYINGATIPIDGGLSLVSKM
ncbi:rhamnolipids biosynthesis 3-oxoacyl-[acyl-carrier-protein] reductase [Gaeumannomyces tritici R3-111a-1]|uniref:Rhamnolipids biosynthesis 3-oxoacyl-[acyl-carrier-protein] reductase n=1 Tax=Gaeumannomyces tritici (strain R3-111a-1) TaxID=644352 RepID=J3P001_GAET3|nr:rhamnolipids biosynthesis 3-oxoacyl-[acyl-carrier-protein] reductase [Gaeumannomyces tritici R3-111a-1]EJT76934.1 rhamnolipids biosynthesis 3-oxoacyl-[acyl-carrier-protein] reductase [Gaeumannomyces tritici R3-111a-1]